MRKMTLGSLFDGSGGFPLAGAINGITPVWASEIEPYPIRVTKARFPDMKHLGSVLDVKGDVIEPVDVITFGSPCQDLSVAGKQKGIHEGERSNLFFEAVRIAKEMRNHDRATGRSGVDVRPRFLVWENVPGAFSSNQGEDFRSVLEALGGIAEDGVSIPRPPKGKWQHAGCVVGNGWSIAWRLYDAQYWGVPQRRKRIYLIADFASERAGEILFEREGMCGHPAEGGEAWEGTADHAEGSAGGSGGVKCLNPWDAQSIRQYDADGVYPTLNANATGGLNRQGVVAAFKGGQGAKAGGIGYQEQVCPTLTHTPSGTQGAPDVVYCLQGNGIDRALTAGCNGKGYRENECYTLNTIDRPAICFAAGFSDALGEKAQGSMEYVDGKSPTLRAGDAKSVVHTNCLNPWDQQSSRQYTIDGVYETLKAHQGGRCEGIVYPQVTGALCANSHPGSYTGQDAFNDMLPVVPADKPHRKYIIRRLTPLECCRLQGFPDWWEQGVEGSDSARYKMWGNGIALPCAADVLKRISEKS